jgi:hypothetical protein
MTIDQYVLDREALDGLARAYAESKTGTGLIFFIGSGPSTSAGLPDWSQLRAKLTQHVEYLVKRNAISGDLKGAELQTLKRESDYWKAFSFLKLILGNATYSDRIREYLTPKPNITIPYIYPLIADFDIRGIITTNIDDLLLKAITDSEKDILLKPVYGKDINDRLEILLRERPFFF